MPCQFPLIEEGGIGADTSCLERGKAPLTISPPLLTRERGIKGVRLFRREVIGATGQVLALRG